MLRWSAVLSSRKTVPQEFLLTTYWPVSSTTSLAKPGFGPVFTPNVVGLGSATKGLPRSKPKYSTQLISPGTFWGSGHKAPLLRYHSSVVSARNAHSQRTSLSTSRKRTQLAKRSRSFIIYLINNYEIGYRLKWRL